MRTRTGLALVVLGAALASACSGGGSEGAAITPRASESTTRLTTTVPTAASNAGAATSAAKAAASAPASTVRKVNANTASRAEIQAALEAAGVPAAANWSREVVEYRPYAATDANWDKLRGQLAKYNPGPGVVDQIVAVLEK